MVRSISSRVVAALLLLVTIAAPGTAAAPLVPSWTQTQLTQPPGAAFSVGTGVGVAAGPGGFVVIGQRACVSPPRGTARSRCWGQAWTSPDGVDWTTVEPRTSGLDLGTTLPVLSGPDIGLGGVAYGPAGFLAFGRAGDRPRGRQSTAIWQSDDGSTWQRLTQRNAFPAGARVRTILGAADGYLLGGVIYARRAPRAAIWSSTDGRSWTLASGRDTFDIGGYIDTMEDPGSGGVSAFTLYPAPISGSGSLAGGLLAAGQACSGPADRGIFSWNATCWGEVWRSPDGRAWTRLRPGPQTRGVPQGTVAIGGEAIIDAPICYGDGASAVLASDDGGSWHVAYGSPVDGTLAAMAVAGGRFVAAMVSPAVDAGVATLLFWISADGSDWRLASVQPVAFPTAMSVHQVAMTTVGDRLLVAAAGQSLADETFISIVLLSPPVVSMG